MPIPGSISQATTGVAFFGKGIARRIRVHVKPPNVSAPINDRQRDGKKQRRSSLRINLSNLFLPTMQDPEHAVGNDPELHDSAESHETSANLTAPAASSIDDATKKAVDNVLYSDVRMGPTFDIIILIIELDWSQYTS